jgi:hypothetical protein
MTALDLLEVLKGVGDETEYAGPEERLDDYVSLSAMVLDDGHPEVSRPSVAGSCGCTPTSPGPPCVLPTY